MADMKTKLGIIGLSDGNGHPYSWSAIFNGYNHEVIKHSKFPAITEYLSKQTFPKDCIKDANITHVWTQNKNLTTHIANSCNILNVVDNYAEMIDKVDAVILARDDYQNHYKFAYDFIKAGLPIYIDKPIATNVDDAKKLFNLQIYEGQIFTCSSFRYAESFKMSSEEFNQLKPTIISAIIPKSWDKYAIHIIEPVVKLVGNKEIIKSKKNQTNQTNELHIKFINGITCNFTTTGKNIKPIIIDILGEDGRKILKFQDPFNSFKNTLMTFLKFVKTKKNPIKIEDTLKVIEIIELGL